MWKLTAFIGDEVVFKADLGNKLAHQRVMWGVSISRMKNATKIVIENE